MLALGLMFAATAPSSPGYGVAAGVARRALGPRMGLLNRLAAVIFAGLALRLRRPVSLPSPTRRPMPPRGVLHHDAHLLVVSKPAGLLSVPGKGEDRADCLIARLRGPFPEVLLVHRLDLDTSGVMVFALTPHAQRHLGLQFEHRRVGKTYVARVAGRLSPQTGTVDLPLRVDCPTGQGRSWRPMAAPRRPTGAWCAPPTSRRASA